MADWLVWTATLAVITSVLVPYWIGFRRRLTRDRQRRDDARRLGIDKPTAQYPFVDFTRCIGCAACVTACPEGDVLGIVGGTAVVVNGIRCVGHGRCETACPVAAIEVGTGDLRGRPDVPLLDARLQTSVPGIYVAGELGGLALVRNATRQGREVIETIAAELAASPRSTADPVFDVVIVGAGPAGLSAALTARHRGLSFVVLEKEASLGGSLLHYPRRKLVLTQRLDLPPWGSLEHDEYQKEDLLAIFEAIVDETGIDIRFSQNVQSTRHGEGFVEVITGDSSYLARKLVLALGRRGSPRKLGVPGEDLPKVMYRLIDARDYRDRRILVVGGGDSAAEAAIGLARQPGNRVTLSYRKERLVRIKQKNLQVIESLFESDKIQSLMPSIIKEIGDHTVRLQGEDEREVELENDFVFVFAGGIPPFPTLKAMGIEFGGDPRSAETARV